MANTKSAEKRARQSLRRQQRNTSVISAIKTARKRARQAIASGSKEAIESTISRLYSALDKAAKRGIIHKNAARRGKSRIQLALKRHNAKAAAV